MMFRVKGNGINEVYGNVGQAAARLGQLAGQNGLIVGKFPAQFTDSTFVGAYEPGSDELRSLFVIRPIFEDRHPSTPKGVWVDA